MPPPPPSAQGPAYGFRQPTMASQRPLSVAYPGPGGFASPPQPPPPRPLPQRQPTLPLAQSFDAMSLNSPQVSSYAPRQSSLMSPATIRPLPCAGSPTQAPPPPPSSPPPNFDEPAPAPGGAPAIVTPMPTVSTLLAAESRITKPSHLIAWSKAVLALVDRTQPDADPTRPEPISDPVLARLANVAVQHVISFASIWQPGSTGVPAHVAEALYLRGTLEASGAFPEKIPRDQRGAFRDFEVAARQGYMPGWFKLGRDYESVKDITHAREVFDRGARAKETSCLYVSLFFLAGLGVSCLTGARELAPRYGASSRPARNPCHPLNGYPPPPRSCRFVECGRPSAVLCVWYAPAWRVYASYASACSPCASTSPGDSSQPPSPSVRSAQTHRAGRVPWFRSGPLQDGLGVRTREDGLCLRSTPICAVLFCWESERGGRSGYGALQVVFVWV